MKARCCQQCGRRPSESERTVIKRQVAKSGRMKPNGWLCTRCRPAGYPVDGLCYRVLTVGGASQ